ncbi:MAG: GNAT family N-acetyltransferase [Actinomycetota bacterium]|nr:GNAT family N-acetyltransferase [Actinomycetota bacterium]
MELRPLDLLDDEQCARAYAIQVASRAVGRPWERPDSLEATVLEWRHEDQAEPREMWAADDDGQLVGVATMWLPMQDNTDKVWVELDVDPDHRHRGVGTALMGRMVERAREEKRTELVADAAVPAEATQEHSCYAFAKSVGFTVGSTEIARHLDLPVADELLDDLAAVARPYWLRRYLVECHVDGVPEELQASLCSVSNQLAVDAPTGEVTYEEESLTPQRYREYLDVERAQGRHRLTTVGVDRRTGHVVAYTDLVLPSGAPTHAWQWGTLVHREHRGHRLGTAVKVENLRRLQQDHPERQLVTTSNDETNSHMVEINARLGFRVVELMPSFHRILTPTT